MNTAITAAKQRIHQRKWPILLAVLAFCCIIAYLLITDIASMGDGGIYINEQYGFTFTFPGSWQNKYVIEESFDSISIRNKKIAYQYSAAQGTLFTIQVREKAPGLLRPENYLGETKRHFFSYSIAQEQFDVYAYNSALQAEYAAMMATLPAFLAEEGRFQTIPIPADSVITKAFSDKTFGTLNALAPVSVSEPESARELCAQLPLANFIYDIQIESNTEGASIALYYDKNAVNNFHLLTIGGLARLNALLLFTLVEDVDFVTLFLGDAGQSGFARSLATARGEDFASLRARMGEGVEPWLTTAHYPGESGRARGLGKVERTAIVVADKAPVLTQARGNADTLNSLQRDTLLRVIAEAGDYYYVEAPHIPCGYIFATDISLDQELPDLPPLMTALGAESYISLYGQALAATYAQDTGINQHISTLIIDREAFPTLSPADEERLASWVEQATGLPTRFATSLQLREQSLLRIERDTVFFPAGVLLTAGQADISADGEYVWLRIRKFYSTNNTIWVETTLRKNGNTWQTENSHISQTT